MLVCFHCLRDIESREGALPVEGVSFYDEEEYQKCEWCGEVIDEGYEIYDDYEEEK